MQCSFAKLIVDILKSVIGGPRSVDRGGATVVEYCCSKFEDFRKPIKKLLWEWVNPVDQKHRAAKRVQMLEVPLPLDGLQSSVFGPVR